MCNPEAFFRSFGYHQHHLATISTNWLPSAPEAMVGLISHTHYGSTWLTWATKGGGEWIQNYAFVVCGRNIICLQLNQFSKGSKNVLIKRNTKCFCCRPYIAERCWVLYCSVNPLFRLNHRQRGTEQQIDPIINCSCLLHVLYSKVDVVAGFALLSQVSEQICQEIARHRFSTHKWEALSVVCCVTPYSQFPEWANTHLHRKKGPSQTSIMSRLLPKVAPLHVWVAIGGRRHRPTSCHQSLFPFLLFLSD